MNVSIFFSTVPFMDFVELLLLGLDLYLRSYWNMALRPQQKTLCFVITREILAVCGRSVADWGPQGSHVGGR